MVSTRKTPQTKLDLQRNWQIESLPGITPEDSQKFKDCGIETTFQLLQKTRNELAKQNLAAQMQIHIQHIHKWVALADFSRLPSVGCEYCGLLLHVGICSVNQLAQLPMHDLQRRVLRFQVTTTQQQPQHIYRNSGLMAQWIQEARQLT
ncbi:hypothetical protein ANSO36C_02480 [Nostoc cf. commune SO-36]|uniref:DUF4332 domain-containing protein n=1 Tax=Nostoc cf. commune SO-36 TaxID=449208 RepID=A0ABM7YV03_NOSCO|nr:DUF4332 domain-containing protein [Nostoc commune]BDI14446.1 hypothetical protein ANSO36C_02480 [Nostoc cf. commune SO-36]